WTTFTPPAAGLSRRYRGRILLRRSHYGGFAVDLIPDNRDSGIGFSFGPAASVSFNRSRGIKDPVVKAAGKLDTAIELGVSGGVTAYKLLSDYDSLTFSGDVRWDVAGAYSGMVVRPTVTYVTPVSKAVLVTLSAGARHVDDKYARYYYSVTPAQAAASGLPEYNAKGGWDSVNFGTLVGWDLSGDLRDGGFALFAVANYSRMLNDGKSTPYTSLRGDADQWLGGLGLAYTF
uniref:MipA/OmpV family protein n=1 Tax=Sphingobium xenophagum TaxID=121428 RepID=UPI000C1FA58D